MCTVFLEKNRNNYKFLIINYILSIKDKFDIMDIVNKIKENNNITISHNLIETCIEKLLDNGQIYEIGSKYKVKNMSKRWKAFMT